MSLPVLVGPAARPRSGGKTNARLCSDTCKTRPHLLHPVSDAFRTLYGRVQDRGVLRGSCAARAGPALRKRLARVRNASERCLAHVLHASEQSRRNSECFRFYMLDARRGVGARRRATAHARTDAPRTWTRGSARFSPPDSRVECPFSWSCVLGSWVANSDTRNLKTGRRVACTPAGGPVDRARARRARVRSTVPQPAATHEPRLSNPREPAEREPQSRTRLCPGGANGSGSLVGRRTTDDCRPMDDSIGHHQPAAVG